MQILLLLAIFGTDNLMVTLLAYLCCLVEDQLGNVELRVT